MAMLIEMLTFASLRKKNRDRLGLWRMQAGLSVTAWLLIAHIGVSFVQIIDILSN